LTQRELVWARLQRRVTTGERHPGHGDAEAMAGMTLASLGDTSAPLALPGPLIEMDTGTADSTVRLLQILQPYLAASSQQND
jgi:hypothetical protein